MKQQGSQGEGYAKKAPLASLGIRGSMRKKENPEGRKREQSPQRKRVKGRETWCTTKYALTLLESPKKKGVLRKKKEDRTLGS